MSITFRANKDRALSYSEMDQNMGSFFYSSSLEGNELVLHYTSSLNVPINQSSHRINLLKEFNGGVNKRIPYYSGSSELTSSLGFINDHGKIGINVNESTDIPLTYHLEVSGSIRASDSLLANSDRRLKEDISKLNNGLDKVVKLEGVTYKWIGKEKTNIGFIAQDIQKILPEVVSEDNNEYLSVNYNAVIPVLVEAIKELKEEINELKSRL